MASLPIDIASPIIICSPRLENDCSPVSSAVDTSIETNMSHYGPTGIASESSSSHPSPLEVLPPIPRKRLGITTEEAGQSRSRTSSISRACAATFGKLSIKLNTSSVKEDRNHLGVSVGRSTKRGRCFKRKPLVDFQPPHCQQKQFDDGLIVHMIGSSAPPRISAPVEMKETLPSHSDLIDPVKDLGLQRLNISIRSDSSFGPSLLQALSTEDNQDERMNRISGNPALDALLNVPDITPISTDLEPIRAGKPDIDDDTVFFTPPLEPHEDSPCDDLKEEAEYLSHLVSPSSPDATSIVTPREFVCLSTSEIGEDGTGGADKTIGSIGDIAEVSADVDSYLKEFSSDIERISLVSFESLSFLKYRDSTEHRGKRWDDLNEPDATSSFNIQTSVSLARVVTSMSSTSLSAPLTQADFDASFEQIFRVSYPEGSAPASTATTHLARDIALRCGKGVILDISHPRLARRMQAYSVPQLRVFPPSSP